MKYACLFIALLLFAGCSTKPTAHKNMADEWQNLFDGKSLTGWTKYLGVPNANSVVAGLNKDNNCSSL